MQRSPSESWPHLKREAAIHPYIAFVQDRPTQWTRTVFTNSWNMVSGRRNSYSSSAMPDAYCRYLTQRPQSEGQRCFHMNTQNEPTAFPNVHIRSLASPCSSCIATSSSKVSAPSRPPYGGSEGEWICGTRTLAAFAPASTPRMLPARNGAIEPARRNLRRTSFANSPMYRARESGSYRLRVGKLLRAQHCLHVGVWTTSPPDPDGLSRWYWVRQDEQSEA